MVKKQMDGTDVNEKNARFQHSRVLWLLLTACLALMIAGGGYAYYRHQADRIVAARYRKLQAVADLKANAISDWRAEHLCDAAIYARDPLFQTVFSNWMRHPDDAASAQIIHLHFDSVRRHVEYGEIDNVIIAAQDGGVLLSLDRDIERLDPFTRGLVQKAFASQQTVFGDFFRPEPGGPVRIDVMSPIQGPDDQPIAVLILCIDPTRHFYPLIESWPTPSPSGETLLLRREGSEALFLNELRRRTGAALSLRYPLSRPSVETSAASAARADLIEGLDYNDVPVLAAAAVVPDTPWVLVAKMDRQEALAEARYRAHVIGVGILLLILFAAAGVGFLYKRRDKRIFQALYRAERAEKEILAQYQTILYSIGDGVVVVDGEGRVRLMNQAAETMLGSSEADAKGKPLQEICRIADEVSGEEIDPIREVFDHQATCYLPGHSVLLPADRERPDGSGRPVADSAAPIYSETGAITGVVVMLTDQSVQRQAQTALRRSEARLRSILEAIPELVMVLDAEGRYVEIVSTRHDLLYKSPQELIGRTVCEVFPTGKGEAFLTPIRESLQTGKSVTLDYALTIGAEEKWFSAVISPMGDDRVIVVVRDMSDHRRLEAQLRQAQKMESVGRLAGGVAHDLNNTLTVILGNAELALADVDPGDPLYARLEGILQAASRSTGIIRQLLAFARKQTIKPEVLDLNEVLEAMLKMLRRLIGEDIDLAWRPAENLWPVKMDPAQIDQILANLCVNARDAIADVGRVTIETQNVTLDEAYCRMHEGFVPGQYAMLAVSDDGCGMEKEILGQIFEPFFTTKDVGKGTGLGLATVYGIVKQNNGFINVYSEPGQGTAFKIYLPRFEGEAEAEATAPSTVNDRGAETILVVEDEKTILELCQTLLEHQGYRVISAASPQKAIGLCEKYQGDIDMLITDVIMPEMNGKELRERIESIKPGIKALYMSGYTADVIADRGMLNGDAAFIQKPFSLKYLLAKVRAVLDAAPVTGSSPDPPGEKGELFRERR